MRAFIALTLPDDVIETLFLYTQKAKECFELKGKLSFVNPKNYHLTLYFLGEVSGEVLGQIGSSLRQAVAGIPPFSIEFKKLTLFPSIKKPHALIASITPQEDLIKLQRKVVSVLSSIGEKINDPQPFLPHVTLARIKETPVLSFNPLPLSLSFRVQDLHVFESRQTQNRTSYHSLFQVQLKTT